MTARSVFGTAAAVCAAALLLVLGAAARPLLVADTPAAPVFTDAEIGFLQDMTAHHQQAVLMVARLSADADPSVRSLAAQIGDTQRIEIGTMMGWLTVAEALPTNPRPMAWMSQTPAHEHHGTPTQADTAVMPGMATITELDELALAHGERADQLFLTLMRRHHGGGATMAKAAAEQFPDGPITRFARSIFTDQTREAATMSLLLDRAASSPP
ncbi:MULTISPECIES: DUF305 domain-containing protein [Nocardia]|uniref:DUF305 domain-containing protein n=1 Tax=Nocardia TaxID=1817 RepID=UPI000D694845|nr:MULTISPECIES: DUF305 domain-containing protein [Nocardia]